jgi:uncharacterized Zn finger protein
MSNVKCYNATLMEKRERRVRVYAKSVEEAINRLAELYNNNTIHTDVIDVVDSEFTNIEEIKEERHDI